MTDNNLTRLTSSLLITIEQEEEDHEAEGQKLHHGRRSWNEQRNEERDGMIRWMRNKRVWLFYL
jgi:hypothetical protein